jgi:hypothetical protein
LGEKEREKQVRAATERDAGIDRIEQGILRTRTKKSGHLLDIVPLSHSTDCSFLPLLLLQLPSPFLLSSSPLLLSFALTVCVEQADSVLLRGL